MQEELTKQLIQFRNDRDWEQFHDSKNLAVALSIEAAELLELFLWTKDGKLPNSKEEKLKEEVADIFAYLLLIAEKHNLDLRSITLEKIAKNGAKYPADKAKGKSLKYNEL
ncbi:MAG: nucleotide pyrophosphohydrolase [Bacteroidetes bacterium]|nr:MAG: nucleotide pyrophosphohydrolase [Bacteroidota bacterium]